MNKRAAKQACKELKEIFQGLSDPKTGGDYMFVDAQLARKICDVADRALFLQSIIDNHNKRKPSVTGRVEHHEPPRPQSVLARHTDDIERAHFPGTADCGPDCCEAR